MAQQTAVEWLFSQIPFEWSSGRDAYEALAIAKQMEKEQISQGYVSGLIDGMNQQPKEYYNETYGNK